MSEKKNFLILEHVFLHIYFRFTLQYEYVFKACLVSCETDTKKRHLHSTLLPRGLSEGFVLSRFKATILFIVVQILGHDLTYWCMH